MTGVVEPEPLLRGGAVVEEPEPLLWGGAVFSLLDGKMFAVQNSLLSRKENKKFKPLIFGKTMQEYCCPFLANS